MVYGRNLAHDANNYDNVTCAKLPPTSVSLVVTPADSSFLIGETKQFTAMAIMMLAEREEPKWFLTGHDMWCVNKKYFGYFLYSVIKTSDGFTGSI